ncbi:MAG: hypothetical protein HY055_00735 [Magnetospirillum sp.]|nr:hypothetical protein [Magnetospirillum sp.]
MARLATNNRFFAAIFAAASVAAPAQAGTSFQLTVKNNTGYNMQIGSIVTENDWYSDGLAGTAINANSSTVITTEMCSSLTCPGKSYIQFPLSQS